MDGLRELKLTKIERIRCDECGRFISYKDLENGEARHCMVLPDSECTCETWESTCKKCLKAEKEDLHIEEYKFALGVYDPATMKEDRSAEIIHVTLYHTKPIQAEIDHLRWELGEDEEFGLTHDIDKLEIIELPESYIKEMWEMINEEG